MMSDSREFPTRPIAAVGAIVFKGERVLVIRRGQPPRFGEWSVPGGAVELGETLRDAARREVREECSIEIEIGEPVAAVDIIERDPDGRVRFHYAIADFGATWVSGELHAASDSTDARWVTLAELAQLEMNPKTRAVFEKAFEER